MKTFGTGLTIRILMAFAFMTKTGDTQMLDMAKTIRQMTTLTAQTTSIITYICARSVEKDITLN